VAVAEAAASEAEAGAPEAATPAAREETPSLEEALATLAEPGGAERLGPHLPELLEHCVPLFEAADPVAAEPIIERLRGRGGNDG